MNARWRIFVAATAALLAWASPAHAQEQSENTQNSLVGPPQLRDFSIEGRVTREAPAPVEVQPGQPGQRQPPAQRQPGPVQDNQAGAARQPSQPPAGPRERSADSAPARQASPPPQAGAGITAPAQPSPPEETGFPIPEPAAVPAAEPSLDSSQPGLPVLPWLIAALALAGAAIWFFRRQQHRERYAAAGPGAAFDAPSPLPRAGSPIPAPRPERPPPVPGGIVSTRLRPALEIEFKPQRGVIDQDKVAIAFELSVVNSGSVPARDVLLEASLFNAGPMQDRQIQQFYDQPVAQGDRIPVIPPFQKVSVNTAVFLTRDQVRPIDIEGRKLFVPMIAFNALYRWTGGEGQTSTSYLVGKETKSDKLAAFRMDAGPRIYRGLAAREHQLRLRK